MKSVRVEDPPTLVAGQTPHLARRPEDLAEKVIQEMHARAAAGERPDTEVYFQRHPELLARPQLALRLVLEEAVLRQLHGEPGVADEVLARYPHWREELRRGLQKTKASSDTAPPPLFAHDGIFAGFRLLNQLGHGAEGQVFLALQPELANRPVVLKITRHAGDEHLSLARLQHTHIVPLYGVYEDARSRRRALCMPFFGNATLQHLLEALADIPPPQRRGADLVAALDRLLGKVDAIVPREGPSRTFLAEASYPQAVAWLGLGVAEALRYAHDHHLIHLDLKPSNILIAANGQPMLLDFHIARAPIGSGQEIRCLGGTPAYMAPEQREALCAVAAQQPVPRAIDGRSDLYSLGLLLYEALGGPISLASHCPVRALAQCNPTVSIGLSDILARCLAPRPEERYPDAGALAEDLRRHLQDLPLRGVANRSLRERWQKWRRRHPRGPALIPLLVATLGMAVFAALVGKVFAILG